jgi:pimeloyl-ACP methyl ester carboxylesterase
MGGMTAALVASRGAVELGGLVLVDPTFISPEWQREVRDSDVAEQHRRALTMSKEELVAEARARQPHRSLELLEILAEARLKTRTAPFDVLTPPNPDYRQVVSSIQVPTLLVIGDKPVVSPETAEELRLLNPRLRVEQLQGAGHGVPYDQPERLAAAIRAFARDVTSP